MKPSKTEHPKVGVNGNQVTLRGDMLRWVEEQAERAGVPVEKAFNALLRTKLDAQPANVLDWLNAFPAAGEHDEYVSATVEVSLQVATWLIYFQSAKEHGESIGQTLSVTLHNRSDDVANELGADRGDGKAGAR